MAHTDVWNAAFSAAPTDLDDMGDGAQEIRNFKRAFLERFAVNHYIDIAGTDADHGEHTFVTLRSQAADPANIAAKGQFYIKTVNGVTDLYYRASNGNVARLTVGGVLGAGTIKADIISEVTAAAGVTIDGVKIKDSKITTANSVEGVAIVNASVVDAKLPIAGINGNKITDNTLNGSKVTSGTLAPSKIQSRQLARANFSIGTMSLPGYGRMNLATPLYSLRGSGPAYGYRNDVDWRRIFSVYIPPVGVGILHMRVICTGNLNSRMRVYCSGLATAEQDVSTGWPLVPDVKTVHFSLDLSSVSEGWKDIELQVRNFAGASTVTVNILETSGFFY